MLKMRNIRHRHWKENIFTIVTRWIRGKNTSEMDRGNEWKEMGEETVRWDHIWNGAYLTNNHLLIGEFTFECGVCLNCVCKCVTCCCVSAVYIECEHVVWASWSCHVDSCNVMYMLIDKGRDMWCELCCWCWWCCCSHFLFSIMFIDVLCMLIHNPIEQREGEWFTTVQHMRWKWRRKKRDREGCAADCTISRKRRKHRASLSCTICIWWDDCRWHDMWCGSDMWGGSGNSWNGIKEE